MTLESETFVLKVIWTDEKLFCLNKKKRNLWFLVSIFLIIIKMSNATIKIMSKLRPSLPSMIVNYWSFIVSLIKLEDANQWMGTATWMNSKTLFQSLFGHMQRDKVYGGWKNVLFPTAQLSLRGSSRTGFEAEWSVMGGTSRGLLFHRIRLR